MDEYPNGTASNNGSNNGSSDSDQDIDGWTLAGLVAAFAPVSLLSLLSLQKVTGDLRLENYGITAHIYMQAGEVVHAALGRDRGLPALFYALSWTAGRFFFFPRPIPAERTITRSLPVIQVRAALWMERWRQLERVFPSIWHRVAIHPQPPGEVIIQPHQWQVLTRIVSQPMSLIGLATSLNQDVMAMARVSAELVNLGLAMVLPPEEENLAG
jgi:hypothetical protein